MDMYGVSYDAQNATVSGAGAQFKYARGKNLKEHVTAVGPITESVELKVRPALLGFYCGLDFQLKALTK